MIFAIKKFFKQWGACLGLLLMSMFFSWVAVEGLLLPKGPLGFLVFFWGLLLTIPPFAGAAFILVAKLEGQ